MDWAQREKERAAGTSFPAGGGQTSSCLGEGVSTNRTGLSPHLIHSRSLTSHLTSPLLHSSTRGRKRRRRRCPFSPCYLAGVLAPARLRTRSRMGNPLSSWGRSVCRRASCLRTQISLPPTPHSTLAKAFQLPSSGRGPRYVQAHGWSCFVQNDMAQSSLENLLSHQCRLRKRSSPPPCSIYSNNH